ARVAHVEDAESGVPHRCHDERRVVRVVDVVVVDRVVLLGVELRRAVRRIVDLESELRDGLRVGRIADVGQPRLRRPRERARLLGDATVRFFYSSRRRHTNSVSAFLLNRSSDLWWLLYRQGLCDY